MVSILIAETLGLSEDLVNLEKAMERTNTSIVSLETSLEIEDEIIKQQKTMITTLDTQMASRQNYIEFVAEHIETLIEYISVMKSEGTTSSAAVHLAENTPKDD
ncbi:hypothetical protein CAEBREN_13385 [Caenorhabditis brenneri]|uniref:Uncharacterized protein n=1 Tax=Caenorhabditis brenneri TaxID=135651 RepID=G0MIA6_CAEBE|nr:hypothetical protein CAEBREN_13385 [Caenorhabditis brenneri]